MFRKAKSNDKRKVARKKAVLASILNIFLGFIGVWVCLCFFFFYLFHLAFTCHVLHKKYSFWQLWAILAHINSFGLQNSCVWGNWTMSDQYKPLWAWQLKKKKRKHLKFKVAPAIVQIQPKTTCTTTNDMGPCTTNLFSLATQLTVCHSLRVNFWPTDLFIMTVEMIWPSFIKYSLFNYTDKTVTLGELFI